MNKPRVKLLTMWVLDEKWQKDTEFLDRHPDIIRSGYWESWGVEVRNEKRFYTMVCRAVYKDGVIIGEERVCEEKDILFFCTQIRIKKLKKRFIIDIKQKKKA